MTKIFPDQLADGGVGAWARASAREHHHRLGLYKMGRADPGGEMELRAPEDAPETCWACRDARRDDPHPSSCTCCLSGRQENEQHLIGISASIHL